MLKLLHRWQGRATPGRSDRREWSEHRAAISTRRAFRFIDKHCLMALRSPVDLLRKMPI